MKETSLGSSTRDDEPCPCGTLEGTRQSPEYVSPSENRRSLRLISNCFGSSFLRVFCNFMILTQNRSVFQLQRNEGALGSCLPSGLRKNWKTPKTALPDMWLRCVLVILVFFTYSDGIPSMSFYNHDDWISQQTDTSPSPFESLTKLGMYQITQGNFSAYGVPSPPDGSVFCFQSSRFLSDVLMPVKFL